ncbi:MAG: DUF4214 domain-containing protein [Xenococcaceae cyanobacterium]
MTLPGYTERIGTRDNDSIEGLQREVVYGLDGDDVLTPGYEANEQGADAVFVGSLGSDLYLVRDSQTLVAIDASNSDGDIVDADGISFNNEDSFALTYFDSTLLLFDTSNSQLVFIPDWQNPENRIEEFRFEDETLSYDELVTEIETNDKYLGNFTESQTINLPNGEEFEVGIEGDLEDLNSDVQLITERNQEIENPILELTGGTAQIAYVAYYGRPADRSGLAFWNDVLTENDVSYSPRNGDTLTGAEQAVYNQIVNQFGTSEEADRLFGVFDSNRDRVNAVYQLAFNRDGDEEGLNFWTNQIELGNVSLAAVALEVGLGAQNEDIITLNNKIISADFFSDRLDTEAETNAYSGSSGELFGRNWLDGFGDNISTPEQVDAALADLVDG